MLAIAFFVAAFLYASVGHGGASGYLAVMALAQFAPSETRPIALLMNVLVASIAWFNFYRAGHFRWSLFWPLILLAVPCAYWGGLHRLSDASFELVLGLVLVFSAMWLLWPVNVDDKKSVSERHLSKTMALPTGAALGGLAGLTGIGGGIFLSPLLILGRICSGKVAGAISAGFIVLNSIAGLIAQRHALPRLPSDLPIWMLAVGAGGLLGSYLGAHRLPVVWIKRLLAVVLLIAAIKLLW
jgi:uncharacterized protein